MTEFEVKTDFWCQRVQAIFKLFVNDTQTINHLLLYGPPGSGKTTAAHWLVDQIWGNSAPLMCMSMNAADERSLDSIRQKASPFFRMDWRSDFFSAKKAPRFLILDECETLTEPAQMTLTNICDSDPQDLCLILICNCQSRIHTKLRNRLLKIRFDPPSICSSNNTTIYDELTRSDLRISSKNSRRKDEIIERLWRFINGGDLNLSNFDVNQNLLELSILLHSFGFVEDEDCLKFNTLYCLAEKGCHNNLLKKEIDEIQHKIRSKIEELFHL